MRNTEVRAQTADPNKIACRDCIYRDQETLKIDGKVIQVGIMRATCLIFDGKKGRWKPDGVDLGGQPCPFYEQDETAPRFWEKKKG